jgi:ABC-type branched-subunit amino acid transport system substrate-binding protein
VAAAVSALAVLTAACGSSTKSASTPTTASGATSTTGATTGASSGPDIVVKGVAAVAITPGTDTGFQARITRFNNQGGLNGRKVKFLGVDDDGSDPSRNQTIVQSLVLKDHVFAVAPIGTTAFLAPSSAFLTQNHVPALGYGAVQSLCGNPWAFGYAGCQVNPKIAVSTGWNMIEKASGVKIADMKVALEGISLQAAQIANKAAADAATSLGAKIVYNKNEVPLGGQSVDYTPFVQSIMAAKPNVVFEVTDLANSIGLAGALKAAGFKGVVYNGTSYLPAQIASQANLASAIDGVYVLVQGPAQEDQSPAIKQEEADLKAIGAPTTVAFGTTIGYWTADMFIQMLKATAAKGEVTPETFQQTVNAGMTVQPELSGGNGPTKWPEAETAPMPCASLVQASGNHYVSKAPFSCYPNINLP